ncbi:MAG: hypothetical protein ACXWCO_17670 [Caldimonas sp.]
MPFPTLCRSALLGLAGLSIAAAAWAQTTPSPCAKSAQGIPQRSALARDGSEFAAAVSGMTEPERDLAIRGELIAGNLPSFLHKLLPTTLNAELPTGETVRLTLCVLADYLSIGSDKDFLRVPMSLDAALAVAADFGFTLPTRRIVDLIYGQSAVRLSPQPLPAGDEMRSTAYYVAHQALVQQQRAGTGAPPDALTAGHKKDLVLSARLWSQPGRVAIYGWHRGVGAPIQPLSTVHGARYADYSHGVRLVSDVVFVNGQPRSIYDVLADKLLAPLLSDEGPLLRAAELRRGAATLASAESR